MTNNSAKISRSRNTNLVSPKTDLMKNGFYTFNSL